MDTIGITRVSRCRLPRREELWEFECGRECKIGWRKLDNQLEDGR